MGDHSNFNLPPGFHFYPTDEELVVHFLHRKAALLPCHPDVIPDLDIYSYDPWDLQGKAMSEGNKLYFYSRKTGTRVTENGYWDPLGTDEPIYSSSSNKKVGVKRCYVFCFGEKPTGVKSNWVMQEFQLPDSGSSSSRTSKRRGSSKIDHTKWVLCRVYEHDNDDDADSTELSCLDEVFLSLDDFDEISFPI